nr:MAG TPA: hypothetical protein [Caudoviricetes sp.]
MKIFIEIYSEKFASFKNSCTFAPLLDIEIRLFIKYTY